MDGWRCTRPLHRMRSSIWTGLLVWTVACGGRISGDFDASPSDAAASFDAIATKDGGGVDAPFATCSLSNCTGCCDANGACHSGSAGTECGSNAQACVDCTAQKLACAPLSTDAGGGVCVSSAKVTCTPQNCTGCCEGDTCRPGNTISACGTSGGACVGCPLNAACSSGSCVIDTSSCSASNCVGCCIGDTCFAGVDMAACGENGAKCDNCSGNGSCFRTGELGGGHCASGAGCGPGDCPTGCCDQYYQCHTGDDALACGGGGSFCGVCSNSGTCSSNTCTLGTCNGSNCSGCCDDFGVCHTTTDLQHCGADGSHCASCPSGYACQDSQCVSAPPCTSQSCNGCCDEKGNCSPGTLNADCGKNGDTCAVCSGLTQCLQQSCQ